MDLDVFNSVDLILMAVIVVSMVVGLARGFFREFMSLVVWATAIMVAWYFRLPVAELMVGVFNNDDLRSALGFGLVMVASLLVGMLLLNIVGTLIRGSGLSGLDRTLGMAFGLLRGLLVATALMFLLRDVFVQTKNWRQSSLVPQLVKIERWGRELVGDHQSLEDLMEAAKNGLEAVDRR